MSDTDQSPPPSEPDAVEPFDMPVTLEMLESSFDRVGENLKRHVDDAINSVRTLMVKHYHQVNARLDSHAKSQRAVIAELRELRAHVGKPGTAELPDPEAPPLDG